MCFGENVTSIYSFQNYWTFAKRVLDKDERHLLVLKNNSTAEKRLYCACALMVWSLETLRYWHLFVATIIIIAATITIIFIISNIITKKRLYCPCALMVWSLPPPCISATLYNHHHHDCHDHLQHHRHHHRHRQGEEDSIGSAGSLAQPRSVPEVWGEEGELSGG